MSPRATGLLKTVRILWAALFVSTFMLLGVVITARQKGVDPPPFVLPLAGVALANAVVAVVLPRVQYRNFARRKEFELASDPNDGARVFARPSAVIEALFPMYNPSFLLGMALAESVALLGFVIVYLGHPVIVGIPFFVVCWVLQATKFPTFKAVVSPAEATTKATFRPD